jgi:hypothetical protein
MDLNTTLTVRLGMQILGGGLLLAAAFAAWIYVQFIKPLLDDLKNKTDELGVTAATAIGRDIPVRIDRLELKVPSIETDVAVLKASEEQRNIRLAQGLSEIADLVKILRNDVNRGDLDSRIASANALVRALQIAVTLAKISSADALERAQSELREAELQLQALLTKP